MPHVNTKAAFAECAHFLQAPTRFLPARINGRIQLDHDNEPQLQLQALLFDTLFSRSRSHPWDQMAGRRFRDLVGYFSWLTATPHRITICTNTADRIASYLVPHSRSFPRGGFEYSGIPGLRIEDYSQATIHMRHLPSGGRVELRDTSWLSPRLLRQKFMYEVQHRSEEEAKDGRLPDYQQQGLTAAEIASTSWRTDSSTRLRAALLARANLWWNTFSHQAMIFTARRSSSAFRLRWTAGLACGQIGWLLTESALTIPDTTFEPQTNDNDVALISHANTSIELDGPSW